MTHTSTVSGNILIRLEDVHLSRKNGFGRSESFTKILRGLSLTVRGGESLAIVGPSGAGKTTALMIMAGLDTPDSGSVYVAGTDLTKMDEDGLATFRRDTVGVVFQAFHLIPTMTAQENVALPLEFLGEGDALERARAQLEAVGLGHRVQHMPGQLSGGEQQRVALARATVSCPPILLADEPTGNLDEATGEQVIDLLFGLARQQNMALVLITHNPDLAQRCDVSARLVDGQLDTETSTL